MKVTPKYGAYLHRDATLLLRPKTQLQDITIEVNPGTSASGHLKSGEVIPLSQTAPNVKFDEFLAGLDTETRAYLQELLAGAGEGFKNNGRAFAATLKRFDPLARYTQEIASQVEARHTNIAHSIHNFRLLVEAVGGKDKQISQLVDSSNAVFAAFAKEEKSVQSTLRLLPGALKKTGTGLGKLASAADQLGPTLHKLAPTARAFGPAQVATRRLAEKTTPIFKHEIRPFARQILPVVNQIQPDTKNLSESFPKLATSFSVLNEFFNELAYNPGASRGGFLFFLDWDSHNLNSVVSSADAHGPIGRGLLYLNCNILPLLNGIAEINPTVNLLVGLLNPPTKAECQSAGILPGAAKAASAHAQKKAPSGPFSGLGSSVFGHSSVALGKTAPSVHGGVR
jgi:phospholipid/cholesterol/gamma-HCH transport system substrate-binding protein